MDSDIQERMFTLITKLSWTSRERYRRGLEAFIRDCSTSEFDVIEHILTNLRYCTSVDLEDAAEKAGAIITKAWHLDPDDTMIVGLSEPNKTCGSTAYVRAIELQLPRCWDKSINTNFVSAFRHRDGQKNLILIDDFIGTGEKLNKKIESLRNNPKTQSYTIHAISFAGMSFGIDFLSNKLSGRLHSELKLERAISNEDPIERGLHLIEQMESLEKGIFTKPGAYTFGYKKSETAFYLEATNIPNNNFPILWWDKYSDETPRETLFSRR
ncbi:phosphoribosyltransferase-like protein [Achromobacter spanius]